MKACVRMRYLAQSFLMKWEKKVTASCKLNYIAYVFFIFPKVLLLETQYKFLIIFVYFSKMQLSFRFPTSRIYGKMSPKISFPAGTVFCYAPKSIETTVPRPRPRSLGIIVIVESPPYSNLSNLAVHGWVANYLEFCEDLETQLRFQTSGWISNLWVRKTLWIVRCIFLYLSKRNSLQFTASGEGRCTFNI